MKKEVILTVLYLTGILFFSLTGLVQFDIVWFCAVFLGLVGSGYCIWKAKVSHEKK